MRGSIQTRRRHLLENFTRSIITPEKIGVCFGVSVKISKLICRQQIKYQVQLYLSTEYHLEPLIDIWIYPFRCLSI